MGEEYVTVEREQRDGLTEVTLEGEGRTMLATVAFDESIGRERLQSFRDPESQVPTTARERLPRGHAHGG